MPPPALCLVAALLVCAGGARAQDASGARLASEAAAPEVAFERADAVEAALPQSSVYAILEDRRGFLWFATREGLGRWDGHTMRTWRRDPFNAASLPGNLVRHLAEDGHGDLWAQTEGTDRSPVGRRAAGRDPATSGSRGTGTPVRGCSSGRTGEAWLADATHLWRFSRERDAFVRVRRARQRGRPAQGLATRDGTIWIATAGGVERTAPARADLRGAPPGSCRPETPWGTFASPEFSPFGALAEDARGTVWVSGTRLGRRRGGPARRDVPAPAPSILGYGEGLGTGTILTEAGALWLATLDGVYRYDLRRRAWARHSLRLPGNIPTQNWVTALHRDREGTLWAGTVWGLHRALAAPSPFRLLAHDPDDPNTIGSGIVLSIAEDRTGALWVGTLGGGLNRIDARGRVARYRHRPGDPRSLSHDWIWSLQADADTLWIGTGGGLNALASGGALPHPAHHAAPCRRRRLGAERGRPAPGPRGHAVVRARGRPLPPGRAQRRRRRFARAPASSRIRSASGGAWLATSQGLLFYDATARRLPLLPPRPRRPDEPARRRCDHAPPRPPEAAVGGTQSGLARLDLGAHPGRPAAPSSPSPRPMASRATSSTRILEDDDGRLWISTNRGLARYDETGATPRFRALPSPTASATSSSTATRPSATPMARCTSAATAGVTVFHPDALRGACLPPARRASRRCTARRATGPRPSATSAASASRWRRT